MGRRRIKGGGGEKGGCNDRVPVLVRFLGFWIGSNGDVYGGEGGVSKNGGYDGLCMKSWVRCNRKVPWAGERRVRFHRDCYPA